MTGQLFTHYFLTDGIKATGEWPAGEAADAFRQSLAGVYRDFAKYRQPNEAVTEQDLIRPVLDLLGWTDYLPQQGADRNQDIPDHLLFADAESKAQAAGRPNAGERYRDAAVVEESKRFGLPLDARDSRRPSTVRHAPRPTAALPLDRRHRVRRQRIRWGVLTNGRRLAPLRPSLPAPRQRLLRGRPSGDTRTGRWGRPPDVLPPLPAGGLHPPARRDRPPSSNRPSPRAGGTRSRSPRTSPASSSSASFPTSYRRLPTHPARSLPQVRQAALVFLYRLLFVLYAEDRGLLPVNDIRYDDYGLRKRVRDDISRRMDDQDTFSSVAGNYYNRLIELFRMIDKGDPSIGLPPYNGGLFASEAAALLERVRLADSRRSPRSSTA